MLEELDEAFNYLLVVLGIMAGALSGIPELYPSPPYPTPEGGYTMVMLRVLILPVIILVFIWLWGLLARNKGSQVIAKSLSWILAFIILVADLTLLFFAFISPHIPTPEEAPGGPGALLPVLLLVFYAPAYVSVLLNAYVIRPRMMEIYKDSQFLKNQWGQALLYIGTAVLYHLYYFGFAYVG